jgi:hypothetical protein
LPECPMRGIDHLAFVTDDMLATMDFHTRDNAERVCNFHARPSALRD